MSVQPEADDVERIPRHDEVLEFDPDEFATAFTWAMKAVSGEAHIQNPAEYTTGFTDEAGEQVQYRFADTPMTRIMFALSERYRDVDRMKFLSAVFRILALLDLVSAGGLEPWVRPAADGTDHTEIQNSVIAAAAMVHLNRKLQFPVREFMRKVREIEAAGEG